MRTLIRGGWVAGFQEGRHAILREGVVVFEGDRIVHVGRSFEGAVDRTLDATGKLVSPGFVNIHALASIDIQTLVLDTTEAGIATSRAYATAGNAADLQMNEEQLSISALFSLAQLVKAGSTTIVEITAMAPSRFENARGEVPALVEAAGRLGARLYTSHKFRAGKRYLNPDGTGNYHWDVGAGMAGLSYGAEMTRRYEGVQGGRIRTMIFPYQYDASTPELLAAARRTADDLGVPIHLHTSQTLFEFHDSLRRYGRTPVQMLDEIGFLGDRTILTHVIYTSAHPQSGFPVGDDSDLRILADRGVTVAHCPVVYARRDRLLDSFSRYRERGINVALGTDTYPQDMIEEMRWAALGGKWQDRDANRATAGEVFNAATVDGARALGRDDLGRLEKGAKADIVIVDFQRLHIGPVDDPIKSLVYAAKGSDVETVIVDGRVVVEQGRIPDLDERALIEQARSVHLDQRTRFTRHHPLGKSERELFPSQYPSVTG